MFLPRVHASFCAFVVCLPVTNPLHVRPRVCVTCCLSCVLAVCVCMCCAGNNQAEVNLLKDLRHENIVRYIDVVISESHINLILEYACLLFIFVSLFVSLVVALLLCFFSLLSSSSSCRSLLLLSHLSLVAFVSPLSPFYFGYRSLSSPISSLSLSPVLPLPFPNAQQLHRERIPCAGS